MRDHRATMTIELACDADPISGRIWIAETEHPFTGWLELASLLERARDTSAARPPHDDANSGVEPW